MMAVTATFSVKKSVQNIPRSADTKKGGPMAGPALHFVQPGPSMD